MKFSIFGFVVILIIGLVLALALTNFNQSIALDQYASAGMIIQQATPTPTAEGTSEIGSTDGILVMGIVITLIVTLPLLFRKK